MNYCLIFDSFRICINFLFLPKYVIFFSKLFVDLKI